MLKGAVSKVFMEMPCPQTLKLTLYSETTTTLKQGMKIQCQMVMRLSVTTFEP